MNINRFVVTFAGIVAVLAAAETGVFAIGVGGVSNFAVGASSKCNASDRNTPTQCTQLEDEEEGQEFTCSGEYKTADYIDGQVKDLLTEKDWVCLSDGCDNFETEIIKSGTVCQQIKPPTSVGIPFGN